MDVYIQICTNACTEAKKHGNANVLLRIFPEVASNTTQRSERGVSQVTSFFVTRMSHTLCGGVRPR
jgi:hypothetical protein